MCFSTTRANFVHRVGVGIGVPLVVAFDEIAAKADDVCAGSFCGFDAEVRIIQNDGAFRFGVENTKCLKESIGIRLALELRVFGQRDDN